MSAPEEIEDILATLSRQTEEPLDWAKVGEQAARKLMRAVHDLEEWTSGGHTWWNQMHGSVTGDYENQAINTANADNAHKVALAARANALAALLQYVTEQQKTIEPKETPNA